MSESRNHALGADVAFRPELPRRVAVVGTGNMGQKWLRLAAESPRTEVVAVIDVDPVRAGGAVDALGLRDVRVATDLTTCAVEIDLVVNATIPAAHHEVSSSAMRQGWDVVSEKPAAEDLADGLRLAAVADLTGRMLSISQSRSLLHSVRRLAAAAAAAGTIGQLRCDFAREARFGGFREQMAHPLLLDMAIHAFDTARVITGADAHSVTCQESNPQWSWYDGDAEAAAVFSMSNGSTFVYTGSWCTLGAETSWNGIWRAETGAGVLEWEGEGSPRRVVGDSPLELPSQPYGREGIAAAFDEMIGAQFGGPQPSGAIMRNLGSLAMVEAAVASSRDSRTIVFEEMYGRAVTEASRREQDAEVRARLDHVAHELLTTVEGDAG
ncbi:MAG: Gfo/Idh/MocA family protein [Dermabacteraceae bacterium]